MPLILNLCESSQYPIRLVSAIRDPFIGSLHTRESYTTINQATRSPGTAL
ncbi:predicted protein [Botrytis cinerea T4]|uniref:Uncharacterized protein n=1 Tax=Botryotinia fuckeliana (strain T4) TaxID=999810 RepID=G2XXA4_BOTF4|nr:predicted protein [Botrytis cinerea T4]